MRIIKLGKEEFKTLDEVVDFFENRLNDDNDRNLKGKFRLPSKKVKKIIAKDEFLLFSYEKIVRYTAIAKTETLENDDEHSTDYPYYFVIDMSTVEPAERSLEKIEDFLQDVYGKSIASGQSWSKIPDSPKTNKLWESLRKK